MGDFGALAFRYYANARSLEEFDHALDFLRNHASRIDDDSIVDEVQKILLVLQPIRNNLTRILSDTLTFDDFDVVNILHQRHISNWQGYTEQMLQLIDKLVAPHTELSSSEWEILNDVADALDTQCTHLFKRMSGRA